MLGLRRLSCGPSSTSTEGIWEKRHFDPLLQTFRMKSLHTDDDNEDSENKIELSVDYIDKTVIGDYTQYDMYSMRNANEPAIYTFCRRTPFIFFSYVIARRIHCKS